MVTTDVVNDINSLQPSEQTIVLSLVKSFLARGEKRTVAQERFANECDKYENFHMTMEEINNILQEEV